MRHLTTLDNYGLIVGRQGQVVGDMPWNIVFICNNVVDLNIFYRGGGVVNPLYVYQDNDEQLTIDGRMDRMPNLNKVVVEEFAKEIRLKYVNEKDSNKNTFSPIDILDYVYAVLYSPKYRNMYKEFLKINFPRVPYPPNVVSFWQLVKLGSELRKIHLLVDPKVNRFITNFPNPGFNYIEKVSYQSGKVYINDSQFFSGVPQVAWEFYIGGYQPAQKWLKDRKGSELSKEDIEHYHKIIVALTETDRLMAEIDDVM